MTTKTAIQPQHAYKGAMLNAIGFLFVALGSAGVKLINGHISIFTILCLQSLICFLLCLPSVFKQGFSSLKTSHFGLHVARDIGGILCFLALFASLQTLPLVNATLLFNAAPLWIPFVLLFWLGIKMRRDLWLGLIIGFIGILLVLRPGSDFFHVGTFLALISGILLAFTLVAVRQLALTETPTRILFYYFLLSFLLTLPFMLLTWHPLNRTEWELLLGIGVAVYLSQYLVAVSFQFAKASTLAPISYLTIVYAGILDWLLWNHIPHIVTLIGILLIIGGGIITLTKERKIEKQVMVTE